MAFQLKDGQGTLFPNDRKTSDNQPDHKGSVLIEGKEYEVAAWTKRGSHGAFLSLSIKPKSQNDSFKGAKDTIKKQQGPQDHGNFDDDSMPF
jgi:uncharacterized protein (DUF736 family)